MLPLCFGHGSVHPHSGTSLDSDLTSGTVVITQLVAVDRPPIKAVIGTIFTITGLSPFFYGLVWLEEQLRALLEVVPPLDVGDVKEELLECVLRVLEGRDPWLIWPGATVLA